MPEIRITAAGRAAAIAANNQGLSIQLTTLVVADGRYDTTDAQTAIMGTELARVNFGAGVQSADQLELHALFTAGAWTAYELGVLTSAGVLFAVASDGAAGDVLATKVANTNLDLAFLLNLRSVPTGSVTVNPNISVTVENATETVRGIAEIATEAETLAGTDDERFVTPLKLQAKIDAIPDPTPPNATKTQRGIAELATVDEARAGTDDVRIVTPRGLAAAVPQASTAVQGKVELSTDAEADAGADTARAVTPSNLPTAVPANLPNASTTVRGKVELATNTETQTGTDSQRAVTPAGLSARTATEGRRGIVELATVDEATAGTDTERAVTPAGMSAVVGSAASALFRIGSFYYAAPQHYGAIVGAAAVSDTELWLLLSKTSGAGNIPTHVIARVDVATESSPGTIAYQAPTNFHSPDDMQRIGDEVWIASNHSSPPPNVIVDRLSIATQASLGVFTHSPPTTGQTRFAQAGALDEAWFITGPTTTIHRIRISTRTSVGTFSVPSINGISGSSVNLTNLGSEVWFVAIFGASASSQSTYVMRMNPSTRQAIGNYGLGLASRPYPVVRLGNEIIVINTVISVGEYHFYEVIRFAHGTARVAPIS